MIFAVVGAKNAEAITGVNVVILIWRVSADVSISSLYDLELLEKHLDRLNGVKEGTVRNRGKTGPDEEEEREDFRTGNREVHKRK